MKMFAITIIFAILSLIIAWHNAYALTLFQCAPGGAIVTTPSDC